MHEMLEEIPLRRRMFFSHTLFDSYVYNAYVFENKWYKKRF